MVAHTAEQEERNLREICESGCAPGMSGFTDRGSGLADERIYREHNTHRAHLVGRGGVFKAAPVEPEMQCRCGNCQSHMGRRRVSGVASPRKDV